MANIHIEDSYKVAKADMEGILSAYHNEVTENRSVRSLKREWCVHNFLYGLGVARERTKDVDLNYPQKWYVKIVYFLMGWCKLFIK